MKLRRGAVASNRFQYIRLSESLPVAAAKIWPETEVAPDETGEEESPEPEDIASGEAFQEGYRQGHEAGLQEGVEQGFKEGAEQTEAQLTATLEEQFNSLLNALKAGAEGMTASADESRAAFEAWLPRAVLLVSEYVLRREASTDATALISVVQSALSEAPASQPATVRLHPDDYARIAEQPSDVWQTDHLSFAPDESVSSGGAIVETATRVVDARIESRLLEAAQLLLFPQDSDNGAS